MIRIFCCLILILLTLKSTYANVNLDPKIIDKVKKSIVTIDIRINYSYAGPSNNGSGTGFIHDVNSGLIITNNHITGTKDVASYTVTFNNGQQADAKLLYFDSWQDFGILKINPADMPKDVQAIKFSYTEASENQQVFIVGNNEGQNFSLHNGVISNIYDINGVMPEHSYIVNLNAAGGSSGSPLLNLKGEAIGLNYGGGKTYAIQLHAGYIKRALAAIKANKLPNRQHIGVLMETYSLDKAVKHRGFPRELMHEYLDKFPQCRNKILSVGGTIKGSPAYGILHNGDIIWKVNGIEVAADLHKFDQLMDDNKDKHISLEIFRNGQFIKQDIPLYQVENYKTKRLVEFAGAVFFSCDESCSAKSGITLGAPTICYIRPGSGFGVTPIGYFQNEKMYYRIAPISINNQTITSLDDVIKAAPNAIKKKDITFEYDNYNIYFENFNSIMNSSGGRFIQDVTIDTIDAKPRILEYDAKLMEWVER